MNILTWVNVLCVFVSLYVAFGKPFRPITWTAFWINIGAVAVNIFAVIFHFLPKA